MNRSAIFILLSLQFFASCGAQNEVHLTGASISPNLPVQKNSVDRTGSCTKSFIAGYKVIVREFARLDAQAQESSYLEQLEAIHDACESFFSHHLSTISCNYITKPDEITLLESSVIKQDCDKIQKYRVVDP